MKLAIGADHAAFAEKEALKEFLQARGCDVTDVGTHSTESVDYPDFAKDVARLVSEGKCERGVLLCHTGIGMSMAANKFRGVRAALVHDEYTAKMSRAHNNANVLCFGSACNTINEMEKLAELWLDTRFDGGERHVRRVAKLDADDAPESGPESKKKAR